MADKKTDVGRRVAAKMPFVTSFVGMTIVFAGLALFYFGNPGARLAWVSVGTLMMVGGMWYAANPFIKNSRRFLKLRAEMDQFVRLARVLNDAVADEHELERAKAAMHESVDRMGQFAGRADR